MTESTLRTMFYALPLPLGNPSSKARLAGLALMRETEGSAPSIKRLITCKLPGHVTPSPIYLLCQGIDPSNLQHGLCALAMLQELEALLQPLGPDDVLVSFALRHLSVYHAMALQNFFQPELLTRFNQVLDLKVALDTCYYFGQTALKSRQSLVGAVKALGYQGALTSKLDRLEAMRFLYQYLCAHDPKIMAFLQSPRVKRRELVAKALGSGQPLVYIDLTKGTLHLMQVLAQSKDGRLIKALLTDGASDSVQCLNLDLAPLIAPCGILTAKRQAELGFDLATLKARLTRLKLSELGVDKATVEDFAISELPFYDAFFAELSADDKALFDRLSAHDLNAATDFSALCDLKSKLGSWVLCYLNENFSQFLGQDLRAEYARYCRRLAQSRRKAIWQELKLLADSLPENDSKQGELLMRIAAFY